MKPTEILHIEPKSCWQTSETDVPVPTQSWGSITVAYSLHHGGTRSVQRALPIAHLFHNITAKFFMKKIPGIFPLFGGTPIIHMMIIKMERDIRGTKETRTSQLFSVYSSLVTVHCFLPLAGMFSRAIHSLPRWNENGIYISQCV